MSANLNWQTWAMAKTSRNGESTEITVATTLNKVISGQNGQNPSDAQGDSAAAGAIRLAWRLGGIELPRSSKYSLVHYFNEWPISRVKARKLTAKDAKSAKECGEVAAKSRKRREKG